MVILGISFTHDGTISVVRDGENVFSLAEERLNRQKSYIGFPFQALRYVVEKAIVDPREVQLVAVAAALFPKEWIRTFAFQLIEEKAYYDVINDPRPENFRVSDPEIESVSTDADCQRYVERKIRRLLEAVGIRAPIRFVGHHAAHAAAAYYTSGQQRALAITMDGEGDKLCSSVSVCENGRIRRVHSEPEYHSLGLLYSAVTRACGFKVARHEGKITGLAAYGDVSRQRRCLDGQIGVVSGQLRFGEMARRLDRDNNFEMMVERLRELCGPLEEHKDLAAAVQYLLERNGTEYAHYWLRETGLGDLVVAGGVFANVKFNQRLAELDGVDSVYVYPDMGDGGNAYGAAVHCYFEQHPFEPARHRMRHVYLGPGYGGGEIEAALQATPGLTVRRSAQTVEETAALVAEGSIVGWFQGRMEYGPRALGNRSVLASPTDPRINDWLNKRLKRTEFMPFAPSCLMEHADELFRIKADAFKYPAEFMTITFDMHPEWIQRAPAVAHVDGTARPQLVTREANPRYHALLQRYHALTGLPLLVNTSFNVHEEPIVCSPQEAIRSLTGGVIDYLVIDDYICRRH